MPPFHLDETSTTDSEIAKESIYSVLKAINKKSAFHLTLSPNFISRCELLNHSETLIICIIKFVSGVHQDSVIGIIKMFIIYVAQELRVII